MAQSTFPTDADGWTIQIGYPTPLQTLAPTWQQSQPGFSTGIIQYDSSAAPVINRVYFVAPAKFLGNLASCYDQNLVWEMRFTLPTGAITTEFYTGNRALIIAGGDDSLWFQIPAEDTWNSGAPTTVQTITVRLSETSPVYLRSTMGRATQSQVQAVLANVTGILLRADFYADADQWTTTIGNVTLYGQGLDPLLVTLQENLTGTSDPVVIGTATLGGAGASVVALFQAELEQDSIAFARAGFTVTPDTATDTLVASGQIAGTLFGISSPAATATFGVAGAAYTIVLQVPTPTTWTMTDSFGAFQDGPLVELAFARPQDVGPAFYLTSASQTIPSGPELIEGLNLAGQLNLTGPAAPILARLPGAANPLTVQATARLLQARAALTLTATLPHLTLNIPGLPALDFSATTFQAWGRHWELLPGSADQQQVAIVSDVTLGGATLPMALIFPTMVDGWLIGLEPGRSAPLGDVATFLGFLAGANLPALLPDAVRALSVFALDEFQIGVSDAFDSVETFSIGIITDPQQTSGSLWPLLPGIFELRDIGIQLVGFTRDSTWNLSGTVQGTFLFASTIELAVILPVPLGDGVWRFTASSSASVTLSDFANLLGSASLASYLPGTLGAQPGFALEALTVVWDPQQTLFKELDLALKLSAPWTIIADRLILQTLYLDLSITDPTVNTRALSGSIGCSLLLGTTTVAAIISKVAGEDWLLSVIADEIPLPTLADLAGLAGTSVAGLLPDSLASLSFSLFDVSLTADLSQPSIQQVGFTLATTSTWTVIPTLLVVDQISLKLLIDWTTSTPAVTGSIIAGLELAGGDFLLSATRNTDTSWELSAALGQDSTLSLMTLADAIIAGSSTTLRQLGVPDVVLVTAEANYNTASETYHLAAEVQLQGPNDQPWTIDIGVSSLSINSLGFRVDSVLEQNQRQTTTHVTGQLGIGTTATFDIDYQIGGPLEVTGTLIDSQTEVSVIGLINQIASPGSGNVTWTSGVEALDQMTLSGVALTLKLADQERSFQLQGTLRFGDGTTVQGLFVVEQIAGAWEFALAIKINAQWSLGGFTDAFSDFHIDTSNWVLVASSFKQASFNLPPAFQLPNVRTIERGLNFYGQINIGNTLPTMQYAVSSLPSGTIPGTTLIIDGLLTDPLADSFLEVIISASDQGLPLLGWDQVLVSKLALRLYGTPALAFHGEFKLMMLTDSAGQPFLIIIEMLLTTTYIAIRLLPPPEVPIASLTPIFTWANALGITGLSVYLTDLDLMLYYAGTFGGTIGGGVDFDSPDEPRLRVMRLAAPDPLLVDFTKRRMAIEDPTHLADWEAGGKYDLMRPFDPDLIRVAMRVSFVVVAGEPVPTRLAGQFINFTLPYLLRRFTGIVIPDILVPIQFPRLSFDVSFNPQQPTKVLDFALDGELIIYGFHGRVQASFSETQGVYFFAGMDPVQFSLGNTTLVAIQRSPQEPQLGPYVLVNSKAAGTPQDPNLSAHIYVNFFDVLTFNGQALVLYNSSNPAASTFYFDITGNVGSVAAIQLRASYVEALHLSAGGSLQVTLGSFTAPGFSQDGVTVADQIVVDGAWGLLVYASMNIDLNARSSPASFTGRLQGGFEILLGGCHIECHLDFNLTVTAALFSDLPVQIISQIQNNSAAVFGAILQSAECFATFIAQGLIRLALDGAATVLNAIFNTGIDLASRLLGNLGAAANDLADWLWNIFDSHDTAANTKAMQDSGHYTPEQIADAIKQVPDQNYTPQQLVSDQLAAGIAPPAIARALKAAFQTPASQAGQLLFAAQVSLANIAAAFRAAYGSDVQTAEAMYGLLITAAGSTTIAAPGMANTLAPYYGAGDVATVLQTHYPNDAGTAAQLVTLLFNAYQAASLPLGVNALASVLASRFTATQSAPALKTQYPTDTTTSDQMAAVLQTAYTGIGAPLDAPAMTNALAAGPYLPPQTALTVRTLFPQDLDTAAALAALLVPAYHATGHDLDAPGMTAALAAALYPAVQVAPALMQFFATSIPDVQAMIALLKVSYSPAQTAPGLLVTFQTSVGTPATMAAALTTGFGSSAMTLPVMAVALAQSPFTPPAIAPVLVTDYQVPDAATMASTLLDAYGAGAIAAPVMAQSLAASPYAALPAAQALQLHYPSDTATVQQMAGLLASAPYPASAVGPVLKQLYASSVPDAPHFTPVMAPYYTATLVAPVLTSLYASEVAKAADMITVLTAGYVPHEFAAREMATALAAAPFDPVSAAPALHASYPGETQTAEALAVVLLGAYAVNVLTAAIMTSALAAAPFTPADATGVLRAHYLSEATTATQVAALLRGGFTTLTEATLFAALVSVPFRAFAAAPAVHTTFSGGTAVDLAQQTMQSYTDARALRPVDVGVALVGSGFGATDIQAGVAAVFPALNSAAVIKVSQIVTATGLTAAITTLDGYKQAGDALPAAAQKLVQAQSGISLWMVAVAASSVYSIPATSARDLSTALATATTTAPDSIQLGLALVACEPTVTATDLLAWLFAGFAAAQTSLTETPAAQALVNALDSIGRPLDLPTTVVALVTGYGSSTNPLLIATALVATFQPEQATTTTVTSALITGYQTAAQQLYPSNTMQAVRVAFNIASGAPAQLVSITGSAYDLGTMANYIGALAVACRDAGFDFQPTCTALSLFYGAMWQPNGFAITLTAYNSTVWMLARNLRDQGSTVQETAPQMLVSYPDTLPKDLVAALAATFGLVHTAAAVRPMAEALKAAAVPFVDASAAMKLQYAPDWTQADFATLLQVYNS